MEDVYLCWSHGLESGPHGTKMTVFSETAREFGLELDAVDYRDLRDPEARAARLVQRIEAVSLPVILVGSSLGGYVSVAAAAQRPVAGLFLLAPALGSETIIPPVHRTVIVHGWRDQVIPVEQSILLAGSAGITLHLLDDDHRLKGHLGTLAALFRLFLEEMLADLELGLVPGPR